MSVTRGTEIAGVSVCPISNEEAANMAVPASILSRVTGAHFGLPDSGLHFLIHVPISSRVVMTYGAYDVGVRFCGFGKINESPAVGIRAL